MKYKIFKKKLQKHPFFPSTIYRALTGSEKTLYNQVNKWVKTGEVIKLRRGLFTLNEGERKVGLSKKLIANILYSPSYISLEYALSFYGMIPEGVFSVTSVTTKKTQKFSNKFGEFIYRNIKIEAFFGFQTIKDEFGFNCFIAMPEKAILDYLYFNIPSNLRVTESFFDDSLRLQNLEQIDWQKMIKMAECMKSRKLMKILNTLKKRMQE